MAIIGNPIVSTDFPVDYFSGNGSTTAFTLSIAPASVNAIDVEVSGVSQSPQTYTISGTTLTFSAAPPSGSSNIVVKHRGIAGVPNVPSAGSVVASSIADGVITAAKFASGQTPAFNGIAFPATQSASSDANTLDDYEEGTWTPVLDFGGGGSSGQAGTFAGFYTKIGNLVYATALVNLSNKGSGTGSLGFTGLPFASNSNSNYRACSAAFFWSNTASSYVTMMGLLSSNSTRMEVLAASAATTDLGTNPTQGNINNATAFRFSITYEV